MLTYAWTESVRANTSVGEGHERKYQPHKDTTQRWMRRNTRVHTNARTHARTHARTRSKTYTQAIFFPVTHPASLPLFFIVRTLSEYEKKLPRRREPPQSQLAVLVAHLAGFFFGNFPSRGHGVVCSIIIIIIIIIIITSVVLWCMRKRGSILMCHARRCRIKLQHAPPLLSFSCAIGAMSPAQRVWHAPVVRGRHLPSLSSQTSYAEKFRADISTVLASIPSSA
jgi:hypothetical protein